MRPAALTTSSSYPQQSGKLANVFSRLTPHGIPDVPSTPQEPGPARAQRCPGWPDHFVRPGARMHRLRPGRSPQSADGAVRRLHHLHPDRTVRWSAWHGLGRCRLDGGGDRRAGSAAGRAVPVGDGAAGRAVDDRLRPAAPGQAGAVGAVSGDARLRQRPGHRHCHGSAGALQERRRLAVGPAAVADAGAGGADHAGGVRPAAPDPRRAAGAGGDPRRRRAGLPARPADPHPRRHGPYRRRSAVAGAATGALDPGNPAHHRALCGADGPGRSAGNPADAQPHR